MNQYIIMTQETPIMFISRSCSCALRLAREGVSGRNVFRSALLIAYSVKAYCLTASMSGSGHGQLLLSLILLKQVMAVNQGDLPERAQHF
jgi:hypothetical protein